MAITYEKNEVSFTNVIYEDEVVSLRDFLQEKAGEEIVFKMEACDDVHLAILQLMMAYQKNYACSYEFGDEKKLFEILIKGFSSSENHCN